MNNLLFVLCAIISLSAQGQSASWYRSYTGRMDKTSFTLLLHKAGSNYEASVYLMQTQLPYRLSGNSQTAGVIQLTGSPEGSDQTEKWMLTIAGKKISGQFISNNKAIPFTGEEINFEPGATYVYCTQKVKLNPAAKNSPVADFYQSGIWFTNNNPINKLLWPNCNGKTAGTYFLENKKQFFAYFREENRGLTPADYKNGSYQYNLETQSRLMMTYASRRLLVFSSDSYEYTGGAHGIFGTSHYVINRQNKTILQLTDIITDTAALYPLLEKNYRRQFDIPADQSLLEAGLFVNRIPVNENFLLTKKQLGFTFNPYEIAPYSGGQITIYIPLIEFEHLLTGLAKKLIADE